MTSYLAEQDTDTPLARWRFEETTGTTFTDDVGSIVATITGTVTPGAATDPTRPAAATGADFAGGGASMTGVSAWRPQTVEAIATFDSLPSTGSSARPVVFGHDGTTTANPLPLVLGFNLAGTTQGRLGVGYWTGSAWRVAHITATAITAGVRHHIVGVYDGSTNLKVYVDGVQRITAGVTARGTLTGVSGTAWIGRRYDGSAQIDGTLWDLALYNGALSAARVTAHYDASLLPASLEMTTGGEPYFDYEEGTTSAEAEFVLSGGGSFRFRSTNLEATRPAVVQFAAHPSDPTGVAGPWFIQENFADGTVFTPTSHSTWVYTPGGEIERVLGSVRSTRTDSSFLALVAAADPRITNPTEWGPAHRSTWRPEQTDFEVYASVGAWPASMTWSQNLYVAWQRITSDVTTAKDETLWWGNIVVLHKRYNYAGQPVPAAPALTVRQMVHDLIGRGLGARLEYDPLDVEPGTPWGTQIRHAAWWDGVSAREVLDLAVTYAPGMWWAVRERGPSGRPRLQIGQWGGPPRYIFAPGQEGVQLSGGAGDLANRCLVSYIGTTFGGASTTWVAEVRANVRGLAEAGIVRTMTLDLTSEGLMTPQAARARGLSALRQTALARTAGKVVVSRPILDRVQGRMVEPWEIRAGSPVIVCDAPLSFSRGTSLAESVTADGVSVFRHRSTSYDISSNSATLGLDGGSRSLLGRLRVEGAARRYDTGSPRT